MFGLVESGGLLSGLGFCRCRDTFQVLLTSDVGVVVHWFGDVLLFDVVLRFEGVGKCFVLYREVYGFG